MAAAARLRASRPKGSSGAAKSLSGTAWVEPVPTSPRRWKCEHSGAHSWLQATNVGPSGDPRLQLRVSSLVVADAEEGPKARRGNCSVRRGCVYVRAAVK